MVAGQRGEQERRNRDLGDRITSLRRGRGWTRAQLAERAGLSVGVIKKVEWGGTASLNSYQAIAIALDMELALIGMTPSSVSAAQQQCSHIADDPSVLHEDRSGAQTRLDVVAWSQPARPSHPDWEENDMHRRQFVMLTALAGLGMPESVRYLFAAGRCPSLSEEDVHAIAAMSEKYLLDQDATLGGGAVCDVAIAMHDKVRSWIYQEKHSRNVREALEALSGDLGAWAGWLAIDAGRYAVAQRYLQETITHARFSQYLPAELRAMENMCVLYDLVARPRQALQAAQSAQRMAGEKASPRLRAILHMRAARAWARLGKADEFERETSAAKRVLALAPNGDEPQWTRFLTPLSLAGLTGVSRLALGQTARAENELRQVASGQPFDRRWAAAYYTVQLAQAAANLGDSAEAGRLAQQALPNVMAMSSDWLHRDTRVLRNQLARTSDAKVAAREFVAAYDEASLMSV